MDSICRYHGLTQLREVNVIRHTNQGNKYQVDVQLENVLVQDPLVTIDKFKHQDLQKLVAIILVLVIDP